MHTARQSGLTLIEVMVGIFILAVGVLAAAGLQTSSLRATRISQQVQELNAAARSELEFQRSVLISNGGPVTTGPGCEISVSEAHGCELEILPCFIAGTEVTCTASAVSDPAGYSITVTVADDDRSVELQSMVAVLP